jgi:hypothetical protein
MLNENREVLDRRKGNPSKAIAEEEAVLVAIPDC